MNSALKLAAAFVSLAVIITSGTGVTNAYLISRSEPADNSFVSGIEPYGSLTVSKTVEHPFGSAYVIPENVRFSFEIDTGDKTMELELSAGESVTIDGIPISAGTVTVTEKDIPSGFTPQGGASKEIRIIQAENTRADFVNVYAPAPAVNSLRVRVTKTLKGRDWKDSDEFIFILEELTNGKWRRISEGSASKDRRTVDFSGAMSEIVFSEAGTYKFRVREDEGSAGGVTYDKAVRYFDVTVADDDMDGRLEIKGSERVEIGFTNSYAPQGSAAVDIDIGKTMNDISGQGRDPEGFRFGLYEGDRLIAVSDDTSAAGRAVIRQIYTPDDIGTYRLTLREIDGGEAGTVYDAKEYELGVTVTDDEDGRVKAFIYDRGDGCDGGGEVLSGATDRYHAEFFNTYDPADAVMSLEGVKRLEGRTLRPEEFRFELYETGPGYDCSGLDPAATVTNSDEGRFVFDLSYSRTGTYHYVIKEDAGSLPGGVTCDNSEYHVRVDVSDDGGALKAKATVTDVKGHDSDIVFTNTYAPKPSVSMLQGTKLLKGRSLREGEFSFALYRTDSGFRGEDLVCETANNRDGSFSFGELSFDEEGRYYFSVRELAGSPDGDISYDKRVYHVTAKVSDDGKGSLVTDYDIAAVCGGTARAVEEIIFTNVYRGTKHDGNDSKDADDEGGYGAAPTTRTGDAAQFILWMIIMLVSSGGLAAVMNRTIRSRNDKEKDNGEDG